MTGPDGYVVAREILPARVRKALYAAAFLASTILTALLVGFETTASTVPQWVRVSLSVLGALLGPLGLLAASNVPPPIPVAPEVIDPDEGL